MLQINNVNVPLSIKDYRQIISQQLNVSKNKIHDVKLVKQAVDARRKNKIHFVCSFTFNIDNEDQVIKKYPKLQLNKVKEYHYPKLKATDDHIVVVGSGPAGLFCAYNLARCGQRVTLIERGSAVEKRKQDIEQFFKTGKLDPQSNVQFGEGGAGTFSDGKLTTGVKDYRKRFILETFVEHGAKEDILYVNKPHVGTDYLIKVVYNMRQTIIKNGGTVLFDTKLVDLEIVDNCLKSIVIERNNRKEKMNADKLVLAIGHSARDSYEMLYQRGLDISQKSFAVGLRIEHLQSFINWHQYGKMANHQCLPTADYKLAVKTSSGRGVYTFCMCPGGRVINSSSEVGGVVVNGMSNQARDDKNANSAILVTVGPEDFDSDHPLAGVSFQRQLEKKAFELGGGNYQVPVMRVEDYLENKIGLSMDQVTCSVLPQVKYANLNELFPKNINDSLKEGLVLMNQKFSGFTTQAMLSGVESRSSSPVRFYRDENFESNIKNIYPIGEGAGYAGGIMSSAIDGLKCSEMLLKSE
ncbi:NAD(P)/FAD-dependent oxidoreductase [uncultured Thomasclavelia sp.]|uniref:NAD(P)/FAD-dependent oxidoreductase n=1 Tax=uncultured Thomasclavelia sp. TaxID=3025759 RepID=UPI0025ECA137|nr:FAD-dependent oxidoreductase [uncultured Thomasclavelia sp.]